MEIIRKNTHSLPTGNNEYNYINIIIKFPIRENIKIYHVYFHSYFYRTEIERDNNDYNNIINISKKLSLDGKDWKYPESLEKSIKYIEEELFIEVKKDYEKMIDNDKDDLIRLKKRINRDEQIFSNIKNIDLKSIIRKDKIKRLL